MRTRLPELTNAALPARLEGRDVEQFEFRLEVAENRISEATVRIKTIDHVQLAMPSGKEREARAFYEGVLGIPEVPKPPNLAKRGGCWFVRTSLKIHLGVENDFRPAEKAHPAFLVEDLPALKTLIQAAGYRFNIDEPLAGYDRIYVYDPFGNRIELMEMVSPEGDFS
jgi:catechol 2,3-dioxygenase-like lactoylglutathione lyase family enzyme